MSKERQRARAAREAEAAARATQRDKERVAREARDRRRSRRALAAENRSREQPRFGRRTRTERGLIALSWVVLQWVVWQFVADPAGRVAIALLTLVALPAFVVVVLDRKGA